MAQPLTSSISIGEEDSFDLDGPLEIRECYDDPLYPLALEGVTTGGHDVSISISKDDLEKLNDFFSGGY